MATTSATLSSDITNQCGLGEVEILITGPANGTVTYSIGEVQSIATLNALGLPTIPILYTPTTYGNVDVKLIEVTDSHCISRSCEP